MASPPLRNPYLNRAMIRAVDEFYGRRRELQRILSRIGASTPQSVSLVGERRTGKSSLLWHLAQPEIHGRMLDNAGAYRFLMFDFQGQQHLGQDGCCQALTRALAETVGDAVPLPVGEGLDGFVAAAEAVDAAGVRLVCLFDEFETVTRNPAIGSQFYGALRSLANSSNVAFITASRRDLQSLCHNQEISESPFFNIFSEVRVGALADDEVRELIEGPSAAAGLSLAPHADAIRALGGGLPFFVQIACSSALECLAESGAVDDGRLTAAFREEADNHFQYLWESFQDGERAAVEALARGGDADAAVVRDLQAQGYVTAGGAPRLFSTALKAFVGERAGDAAAARSEVATDGASPTDSVETRIVRSPYVMIGLVVLVIGGIGLWAGLQTDPGAERPLRVETLSPARVAALGLSVELQYQVADGNGWRHGVVAVRGDRPVAQERVALRENDRLRLSLTAAQACGAYAFVISPGGAVRRVPQTAARPVPIPAGGFVTVPPGEDWLKVRHEEGEFTLAVVAADQRLGDLQDLIVQHMLARGAARDEVAVKLAAEIRSHAAVAVTWVVTAP